MALYVHTQTHAHTQTYTTNVSHVYGINTCFMTWLITNTQHRS